MRSMPPTAMARFDIAAIAGCRGQEQGRPIVKQVVKGFGAHSTQFGNLAHTDVSGPFLLEQFECRI